MTDNARLIEEANALHQDHFGTCNYCQGPWPCDANQLVNDLEQAEAENERLKRANDLYTEERARVWEKKNEAEKLVQRALDAAQSNAEPTT